MKRLNKILYPIAVALLELLALFAIAFPLLRYARSSIMYYYLIDLAAGASVSTNSAAVGGATSGIVMAVLMAVGPVLLLTKREGAPFFVGLGLSVAASALSFGVFAGVASAASNSTAYSLLFGAYALLFYAIMVIGLLLDIVIEDIAIPYFREGRNKGVEKEQAKSSEEQAE